MWEKGKSGNPRGRRVEDRKVKRLARLHTESAINRLAKIVETGEDSVAVPAANAILDRAYGKPKQTVDATVSRYLISVTEADDLRAKLEQAMARRSEHTEHTVQ